MILLLLLLSKAIFITDFIITLFFSTSVQPPKINMPGGYSPVHMSHCYCKYPCKQSNSAKTYD